MRSSILLIIVFVLFGIAGRMEYNDEIASACLNDNSQECEWKR